MQRPVYMIGRLLFVLTTFLICLSAHAGQATYAPEFTFFVPDIGPRNHPSDELIKSVTEALTKRCGARCAEAFGKITILGTPVEITVTGDQSVFEVHLNLMTLDLLEKYEPVIEEVLFQGMRSLGYPPHLVEGAGHMNIGIESGFGSNVRHMKNFLALIMGSQGLPLVFGSNLHDVQFATPIQYFPIASQQTIAKILNRDPIAEDDISFLEAIKQEYIKGHPIAEWFIPFQKNKFVAIGVRDFYVPAKKRFEVRTLRPQQTFQDFVLQARLIQRMIDHTEKLALENRRVLFKPAKPVETVEDAFSDFRKLVESMKLNPHDYSHFIAPIWKGIWEQELRTSSKSCKALF